MAVIRKLERVTGIEPRGGSELRPSLLKICRWREREIVTNQYYLKNTKQDEKHEHLKPVG